MEDLVYVGEGDLASFSFAWSNAVEAHFINNTDKYKQVLAKTKEGQEYSILWFREECAG